ncbi:MAG: zinc metallopeptidase [Clostridiales bacterium]|nr:zinc metallopeptidase [Clostridiales bacterium]
MLWYYGVAIGIMIWSLVVQSSLKRKAQKGSEVMAASGKTANQVVEEMLRSHGVYGIVIDHKPGSLTDCYSPKEGKIYLSDTTYGRNTVTAIAIAAHECGHAIQDAEGMIIYRIRQMLAPMAGFASNFGVWITIIGVMIMYASTDSNGNVNGGMGYTISTIGLVVYSIAFLFYLFMLPVERNASRRAFKDMKEYRWVSEDQYSQAHSLLRSAGDTYAIALASSALTLLRLLAMRGGSRRR